MSYQPDIPPDVSSSVKIAIHQYLDTQFNAVIVYSFLHGIYTGIAAVTLWNIFTCKSQPIGRQVVVVAVILLFIFTTVDFGFNWAYIQSSFIDNSQSFWSENQALDISPKLSLGVGVVAIISTILADTIMIWRCWMVWGRRWLIVLLPILFLISGIALKIVDIYQGYTTGTFLPITFILYLSFILATTIWCTILIIFRILRVVQASDGIGGGVGAYRHVIEVLIESSALYSVFLVLLIAFQVCGNLGANYLDPMAAVVRGIAPTLLVGRVARGHSRPDESWQGSVMSSLHFGSRHFRARDQSRVEEETLQTVEIDEVFETERGETVRDKYTRAESQEYLPPSNVTLQDDLEGQPKSITDRSGEAIRHPD